MPESRGRKKKNKPKKKTPRVKVTDYGFVEVVRKGKNLIVKNKMSADEHAAYLQQLRENRPKFYLELQQMIARAVDMINTYDKLIVVGSLASQAYYTSLTDSADDAQSEIILEYVLSIAVATPNEHKGKIPPARVLVELSSLLKKIRQYFVHYFGSEGATGKYTRVQTELRFSMILDSLLVRGEGYYTHIRQLFLEMFSAHNDFLLKHYGFTTQDVIDTFDKLEESFGCRVMMPNGLPHPVQTIKLKRWMAQHKMSPDKLRSGEYLNEFVKTNPEVLVHNNGVYLYPLNSIDTSAGLYEIRHYNAVQGKVAKALSLDFGENAVFSKPEKFKYEILNTTLINARPIVHAEGKYYYFNMNLAARNFFVIGQSLIQRADPGYYKSSFQGNRIQITKDNFIERKTRELFEKMLPQVQFYSGVTYTYINPAEQFNCFSAQDGKYELDILGVSPQATYLIEVKAGIVSNEAKRGAIQSIETDLSSIIGDAICQSYRASAFITHQENAGFITSSGENITPLNRQRIFRISISFSYAGSIIASLSKLQEAGILDPHADFAWTVNIFDLIPFTDLMESEDMFIDYLNKRLPLYKDKRLVNVDEMDMLGLYFENDLQLHKDMKTATSIQLNKFSEPIARYYDKGGPKPKKKKNHSKQNQEDHS